MKKPNKIILFVIYCLLSVNCYAQWVQQNSGTSTHLVEVRFINQNTGWACGLNGLILKTTNGGLNWTEQYSGIYDKVIWRIRPVDANVVYCIGGFETFLKTTNGGTNWQIIKNGPLGEGHSYYALHFINQNTGWYCGTGQLVFKTTNGGVTIDSFFTNANFQRDIILKDSFNGLTCGDGGTVYKTTNGGVNWYQVTVPVGSQSADFDDLTFIGDFGWVVGRTNNKVYKTTNFGSSWDSLVRIVSSSVMGSYSIFFSNLNTGWVAGAGFGTGRIYKTTNGGYNWYQQAAPDTIPYSSVFFVTESIGWCAGNYGTILHTTTGGQFVGVTHHGNEVPDEFKLLQNYPNPFNSETSIEIEIPKNCFFSLYVYNVLGQLADIIANEYKKRGRYVIRYNADKLSSGIYFYTLKTNEFMITKKFILLK